MKYKIKSAFQKFATTAITLSGVMTAAGITLSAQSAQALNISFGTTDFTVSSNVSGHIGSNNAEPSIAINTNPSPDGFQNAFTSNFILLGANIDSTSITSTTSPTLTNGNSQAESNSSFTLTSDEVSNPITLTFNWAFNGNASGNSNNQDNFNITLLKTDETDGADFFVRTLAPSDPFPGYGSNNNEVSIIPGGTLSAGDYKLFITLNENSGLGNSAAGFNNITFSAPGTPVPFGFSTNMSLLVFGGMFYGMNKLKKKMAVKKSQA
jgi:hypothetical protein